MVYLTGRVALSRLTRGVVGGSFALYTRFVLGNGCDCSNNVGVIVAPMSRWLQFVSLLFVAASRAGAPDGWRDEHREELGTHGLDGFGGCG